MGLTIPQIRILESNLNRICKAEAGKEDNEMEDRENLANRMAFGGTLQMLKEKTGKESFTLQELSDPAGTLKKYKRD